MPDDEVPPSRLQAIMDVIDELLDTKHDGPAAPNIARWRQDVERTARFLIETYGDNAPERAKHLELRRKDSGFARAVRLAVERLAEPGGKSSS